MKSASNTVSESLEAKSWYIDFKAITKAGLSVSVVFSSLAGYFLGIFDIATLDWKIPIMLAIGGYCMVGASNAFNQIIERDLDSKMDRTKNRPVPAGRLSISTAFIIAALLTVIGLIILYNINPKTAMFAAISIFLYTSVYTPLKTITPLSVFVGAIPGAIPFMLGWVAATDDFSLEAGTLFAIQFFWQFPHFWAIGWFLYDDYKKAGFFMLPTGKKDKATALQTILYTFWLIVASLLPFIYPHIGVTGSRLYLTPVSAVIVLGLGIWMLIYAFRLYQHMSAVAARKLMLVSVLYITLLQLVYVADKFLR
ncbi:MAG TPA: heme o synthase [Flavobacterium sp.]|nr:heme o synthase [Flavobacterium sp.]